MQPLFQWESNEYYKTCICVFVACNVPYCHLWPDYLYSIFPHYLTNGTIFKKKLLNTKCVFWFPLQLLSETFLILGRNERDMIKKYTGLNVSPLYSCPVLMKLEFYWQIFDKSSNIKFHENLSSGSRVVLCERTDTKKLIVAFRNFVNARKNISHSTEPHDTKKLPQYTSLTAKDDFYN